MNQTGSSNTVTSSTRRKNPDYVKITGEVKKDLSTRFKILCAAKDMSVSQALDAAIENWIEVEKHSVTINL